MKSSQTHPKGYWSLFWRQWRYSTIGMIALFVTLLFCFVAVYAPFLASSKPIAVHYNNEWFFPLFRYLLYNGFYTKLLDIFYNLMIFTVPAFVIAWIALKNKPKTCLKVLSCVVVIQMAAFLYLLYYPVTDPASDFGLTQKKQEAIQTSPSTLMDWETELSYMTPYAKLNAVLRYRQRKQNHEAIVAYMQAHGNASMDTPTLWQLEQTREKNELESGSLAKRQYLEKRRQWLEKQSSLITFEIMPLVRPFHWEDDAGGSQSLNRYISWWDLTRINRKDMVASLIFGVRISLFVGIAAVALALAIGIPIGALAGFYGGKIDIVTYRLIEIWESMPIFFMLLMVVAFLQTKSIFLVIGVIGFFGWTGFSRYVRGEFFKQKQLPYAEACKALGFRNRYTIFYHLLPNAIPPILTLVPFAVMGAITSEAGLSFLGLGEEGSCSWGVLMDEGRTAFPSESYLLWPPAILLTILLISIALVGDTLRDALDPKLHK